MADEDKQFDATPHKLKKAREEGQVIKSKDLTIAISLILMSLVISQMAPFVWGQLTHLFILIYEQIPNKHLEDIGIAYLLFLTIVPTVLIIVPIMFAAMLIGVLGELIQVGFLVTTKPLTPKLDKLDPIKGFKNIFSVKSLFELAKNIMKVAILGVVGYITFKAHIPLILGLCAVSNTFSIITEFGKLMMDFITKAGFLFLVIAGADNLFSRWKFLKDQKMSFKEIKDEYKNTEGDPHVKAALRQRRMQMLQQKMLDSVPNADFVTTNPTHIAVALKYKADNMTAPRLVAKGTELFAKKIIDIAKKHNVPVVENPPVARAIFRLVDVNKEIPPELYKAVAEILMFVYNLRKGINTNTTQK